MTYSLPRDGLGWAVFAWGIGGVLALLISPIARLTPPALEALQSPLSPALWAAVVVWSLFMVYTEGYRGFHRQFSPRVVVRAAVLAERRPVFASLLAPFMCTGLVYATRKRRVVATVLIAVIVLLVVVVRQFPQPWRGLVDVGVVLGLSTGVLSVLFHLGRAFVGQWPTIDADVPEPLVERTA